MKIHIGEKIRTRARELKIGPSELGKKVNTSKQNIGSVYKRESIDAYLLWNISKALNFDFFQYYKLPGIESAEHKTLVKELEEVKKANKTLAKDMQALEEKIAFLEKINGLLEKKTKK